MRQHIPIAVLLSSLFACTVAVAGVIGWLLQEPLLTNWNFDGAHTVSIKPSTSISLLALSIIPLVNRHRQTEITVFVIATMLLGLFGFRTETTEHHTVGAMVPSLGTLAGFCCLLIATNVRGRGFAIAAILIGIGGFIGQMMTTPPLYYYFPEYSTGMAVPTAIGTAAVGAAVFLRKQIPSNL